VFPGFVYESERGSRIVTLDIDKASLVDVTKDQVQVYSNGGCSFEVEETAGNPADSKVLAWYADEVRFPPARKSSISQDPNLSLLYPPPSFSWKTARGKAAIVECKVGKGTAILLGVHPEYDHNLMDSKNPDSVNVIAALKEDDSGRVQLLRSLLRRLGLKTSEHLVEQPALTNLGITCVDETTKKMLWDLIVPALLANLSITSSETKGCLVVALSPSVA